MDKSIRGLKAVTLAVLLAAGLSACQQTGAEEDVSARYEADVAEARAAAQRAEQAAQQALAAAQRAEAAAAASQRQAEASSRMFQQGVRK